MGIFYRYGWPLGRQLSKLGVPTKIRLDVIHDDEAGVFVGTSPDLRGLVVEADSIEVLLSEASSLIPDLVQRPDQIGSCTYADVHLKQRLAHA